MGNGALAIGPSDRAHPLIYQIGSGTAVTLAALGFVTDAAADKVRRV